MDKKINLLIYIDALIVLISAIIWTGLPLYFFNLTGSYFYAGSMYLIGGISLILSNFMGSYFYTLLSKYSVRFYLIILLCITVGSYFVLNNKMYGYMLLFMLTFQFFVNALSFVLESSFNLYLSDQPHKDIAFRNVFLLSAKTIGFFVGPILFLFLESTIYVYFAAFFLILLLYEITKPLTYNMEFEGLTLKNLKMIKKLPLEYALVVIVDGMFFPVIMNYSFIILKERYAAEDITISIFWLVGGLSVIASNFLLRKIDIDVVKPNIFSALIVLNVGLVVMYFAQNSYWYLFGFFLLSLINPVFMSMIKSHFLTYFEPKHRSIALAFINTFNQLGTILLITLTILLLDTITGFQTKYIIAICLILGVIRFLFVIKILSEKEKEQFSNEANGLS
ncbi:MFS transporter [Bacillus badius]|uniref:MFS transporter n=1 Tax=Bacillus badius TaxID=1455 RepID=UPI0005ADD64B|nr:MFS transporter [Bacillus badius]KIL74684.1 hypothetical protein SD78_1753 [Bacillus badius]